MLTVWVFNLFSLFSGSCITFSFILLASFQSYSLSPAKSLIPVCAALGLFSFTTKNNINSFDNFGWRGILFNTFFCCYWRIKWGHGFLLSAFITWLLSPSYSVPLFWLWVWKCKLSSLSGARGPSFSSSALFCWAFSHESCHESLTFAWLHFESSWVLKSGSIIVRIDDWCCVGVVVWVSDV